MRWQVLILVQDIILLQSRVHILFTMISSRPIMPEIFVTAHSTLIYHCHSKYKSRKQNYLMHYLEIKYDKKRVKWRVRTQFLALPWHHLQVWSWGNDDNPLEGDNEWLTCVKREPYLLHVKDTLVDFEKE